MEKFSIIPSLIKSADLFSSLQFLRFNKRNKISTIEGGIVSILIFGFLGYSFLSVVSQTFNKTNISYIETVTNNKDGTFYEMKTGDSGNFMFGVRMSSQNLGMFNLSDSKRYVDILFFQIEFVQGQITGTTLRGLQQCTKQHWAAFPDIVVDFDKFQMSNWLCPQMNQKFPLSGSYLSQNSQSVIMMVKPCSNYTNYGASVCHSQQEIDDFFTHNQNLLINFLFTNPILNLQNVDYIGYELNKASIFPINNQFGNMVDLRLSDFNIKTDTSIWPISSFEQVKGLMIEGSILSRTSLLGESGFLTLYIRKSSSSVLYTRQVQKISTIVSYIGGLFGIFYGGLVFMNLFTEQFYLKKMIKKVFSLNQKSSVGKFCEKFNIFTYIQLSMIKFISWISAKRISIGRWVKELQEYEQELNIQLDVSVLISRISKLERLMISIIPHEELVALLNKKQSLRQIRENMGDIQQNGEDIRYADSNPIELNQQTVTQSIFLKNSQANNRQYQIEIEQINDNFKEQRKRQKRIKERNSNLLIINASKQNSGLMMKNDKQQAKYTNTSKPNVEQENEVQVPCVFES